MVTAIPDLIVDDGRWHISVPPRRWFLLIGRPQAGVGPN